MTTTTSSTNEDCGPTKCQGAGTSQLAASLQSRWRGSPATRTMSLGCGAPMRSNFRPAFFSMKGIKPSLRLSTRVMETPEPLARPVLPDLCAASAVKSHPSGHRQVPGAKKPRRAQLNHAFRMKDLKSHGCALCCRCVNIPLMQHAYGSMQSRIYHGSNETNAS